jgi:hypothetical protein
MWPGSGFIPIIIYAMGSHVIVSNNAILTENGLDILTENSDTLIIESA